MLLRWTTQHTRTYTPLIGSINVLKILILSGCIIEVYNNGQWRMDECRAEWVEISAPIGMKINKPFSYAIKWYACYTWTRVACVYETLQSLYFQWFRHNKCTLPRLWLMIPVDFGTTFNPLDTNQRITFAPIAEVIHTNVSVQLIFPFTESFALNPMP